MADPLQLVLWTTTGCGACVQARETMASLSAALRVEWIERDASEAPEMIFGDIVPVVTAEDGEVLAHAPLVARELVDAIIQHTAAS